MDASDGLTPPGYRTTDALFARMHVQHGSASTRRTAAIESRCRQSEAMNAAISEKAKQLTPKVAKSKVARSTNMARR